MMKVLCLHFCYAIPSGQDKTYSINPIPKPNTPMKVLHRLCFFFNPCNTLTLKPNPNTPMMILHNSNTNKVDQMRVL